MRESALEIQGDHRDRLRTLLGGKGWKVGGGEGAGPARRAAGRA
ncbi:MAG: hypothetical protein U0X73_11470 [Thermoanaerobaculia bacterium]